MTPLTPADLARLRAEHLVETDWLLEHIADPSIRIVDMRGKVETTTEEGGYQTARYMGARPAYEQCHLPGAIYLDWTSDLVDENDPVAAQAAPAEKVARVLGERGIGDEHLVIAYDDHPAGQFATRLWWLLRYYGHNGCRVLNGGWKKWVGEGKPATAELPDYGSAAFTPRPQPEWRRVAEDVAAQIGNPNSQIVDARDEGQYSGRIRRGIRGGHIPGALHFPREALMSPKNTFLSPEQLAVAVRNAGMQPEREIIAYCNGGVAATSVLFALSMLGYTRLSNYDGSWNEWNEREELPVEAR